MSKGKSFSAVLIIALIVVIMIVLSEKMKNIFFSEQDHRSCIVVDISDENISRVDETDDNRSDLFSEDDKENDKSENTERNTQGFELVEAAYSQIVCFENKCVVYGINEENKDEQIEYLQLLKLEHPELFWIGNGVSLLIYHDGKTEVTYSLSEDCSQSEISAMNDIFMKKIDSIIETADKSWDDYQKVKYIHDYLVRNTVYDHEAAQANEAGSSASAYGCLVNGKAVCSGYAAAFKVLADRLGIESGIIYGTAEGGSHAWNYVNIDNNYYWLDVTWDDSKNDVDETSDVKYYYFLLNDEIFMKNRTIDAVVKEYPECSSKEQNYFVKNNSYFEKYSFEDIDSYISAHSEEKTVCFMFASNEEYLRCIDDLFTNKNIRSLSIYQNSGYRISYSMKDDVNVIEIDLFV